MTTAETFALDADMREAMRRLAEAAPPLPPGAPIAERRRHMETTRRCLNDGTPPLASVAERVLAGPLGPVKVRLYKPSETPGLPVVVYFHGGGWVAGSLNTHDRLTRMLAKESGFAVLSVDWSLAPEHPFPEPVEEAAAVMAAVRAEADAMGVDGSRMAAGGDSAGANIVLGALLSADGSDHGVKAGVLFYGVYDCDLDTPSYLAFGGGSLQLTRDAMIQHWGHYVADPAARRDPRCAPARAAAADLARCMPPLWLGAAALDPLLDDHRRMVARLGEAGVEHEQTVYDGVVHGFAGTSLVVAKARQALADAGAFLRRELG